MAKACVWCEAPLPTPLHKGHRSREFCDNSCKQKHYLWHKQVRGKDAALTEPYWKEQYQLLLAQYKTLERSAKAAMDALTEERIRNDSLEELQRYYANQYERITLDYQARLRSLGMSEDSIKQFGAYWESQYDSLQELRQSLAVKMLSHSPPLKRMKR